MRAIWVWGVKVQLHRLGLSTPLMSMLPSYRIASGDTMIAVRVVYHFMPFVVILAGIAPLSPVALAVAVALTFNLPLAIRKKYTRV